MIAVLQPDLTSSATPNTTSPRLANSAAVGFKGILQLLADRFSIDPAALDEWLQASPTQKKQLQAQFDALGISSDDLQQLLSQHTGTLESGRFIKTALSESTQIPTPEETESIDTSFIASTLFIAQEAQWLRHPLTQTALTIEKPKHSGIESTTTSLSNQAKKMVTTAASTKPEAMAFGVVDSIQNRIATHTEPHVDNRSTILSSSLGLNQTTTENATVTAISWQAVAPFTTSAPVNPPLHAMPSVQTRHIATPVGSNATWHSDFNRVMVQMGQQISPNGTQHAEIRVEPPELGPLRIVLSVNDSVANAMIYTVHSHSRAAVEHALPQLQQQLAQAGLSLGEANVSDQSFFAQAEQHQAQDDSHSTFSATLHNEQSNENSPILASDSSNRRSDSTAIIDTFA